MTLADLLTRVAARLPLRWQRRLREHAFMLEYHTKSLVVPPGLILLIENRETPDFQERI